MRDKAELTREDFIIAAKQEISKISDRDIITQTHICYLDKCALLAKKYMQNSSDSHRNEAYIPNNGFESAADFVGNVVFFELLHIENDSLIIDGRIKVPHNIGIDDIEIYFMINNTDLVLCENVRTPRYLYDLWPSITFHCQINNIEKYDCMNICLEWSLYGTLQKWYGKVYFDKLFPLAHEFKTSYCAIGNFIIYYDELDFQFIVKKATQKELVKKESAFLNEIISSKNQYAATAVRYRLLYHLLKPFQRKEIWLILDRINKADDNGEALFTYLNERKIEKNIYFVIREDSSDYKTVKEIGCVLPYLSDEHMLYYLLCDKVISSHIDEYVMNPFFENKKYYKDIICAKTQIFLQHGLLEKDISKFLNKYNQDLSLLVTSANRERESIVGGNYFYNENTVQVTGLPRYDFLRNNPRKIVVIAPTWREYLTDMTGFLESGIRRLADGFRSSEYFRFYNALINDERLINNLKKSGYRLLFMLHPNMIAFNNEFTHHKDVIFGSVDVKYRDVFSQGSLLVTDYSSVAFDFSYLRKPIIYCQFDYKDYAEKQHARGYFDYETDGFGEVTDTVDETINLIIEYVNQDCKLKPKYAERINKFYAYSDRNNCERVYNAILNLSAKNDVSSVNDSKQCMISNVGDLLKDISYHNVKERKKDILDMTNLSLMFPCHLVKGNENIIVYGGGKWGRQLFWLNQTYSFCNIIGVVDKDAAKITSDAFPVQPISFLNDVFFDKVLIAIADCKIADEVLAQLSQLGIKKDAIILANPNCLWLNVFEKM